MALTVKLTEKQKHVEEFHVIRFRDDRMIIFYVLELSFNISNNN